MNLEEFNELRRITVIDYLETGHPVIVWTTREEMQEIIDFLMAEGIHCQLGLDLTRDGEPLLQVASWLNFRIHQKEPVSEPVNPTNPVS